MMSLANLIPHAPALIIAVPLFAAFITPLISKVSSKARNGWVVLMLLLTGFLTYLLGYDIFRNQGAYDNYMRIYVLGAKSTFTLPSGAVLPIRIILQVDALSILMACIFVTLAFVAAVYSLAFMKKQDGLDKYYTLTFLLLVGMLGMVLTGDMFNLFVWLEVTAIAGCALVAFFTDRGESVEAAFKYMVIGTVGALFVLFAVGIFYGQYDKLNMADLSNAIATTGLSTLDKIALTLLLAAFAMKAGAVPMHMWKPDAYGEAPSSVAILLVCSSLASLYALFRICFTLYGAVINTALIGWIIAILGILSIFVGVTMALPQTNLKRLIGFTAVAEVGYMMLGIGVGLATFANGSIADYGMKAMEGGIFHIMNDALDLGLLFLVAGAIFYATGKRDLNEVGGLAHKMPYTTVFFLVGMAAVAGLPPMNGFASKLMIYESVFYFNPVFAIIGILASILMLAIFVKVFYAAFLGPQLDAYKGVKEVPLSMLIGMGILALLIVLFGLFPDVVVAHLVHPAANALIKPATYVSKILGGA